MAELSPSMCEAQTVPIFGLRFKPFQVPVTLSWSSLKFEDTGPYGREPCHGVRVEMDQVRKELEVYSDRKVAKEFQSHFGDCRRQMGFG